jgi:hypothetical protein
VIADLEKRSGRPDPYPRAFSGFTVPGFFALKNMFPERIGATLGGTILIHRTPTVAPENTVMVFLLCQRKMAIFSERNPDAILLDEFFPAETRSVHQGRKVVLRQKHVPAIVAATS